MEKQRRRFMLGTLAASTLAHAPRAWAQKKYDPGASDAEIVLGMPMPLSGPVSGFAIIGKVAEAYFKKLNADGGINGRKVRIVVYDDQYSPPKMMEVVRRMVEQDQVLAVFSSIGTGANIAVQRYMNTKKVPQLLLQSGASHFDDAQKSPWTTPLLGSYKGEGRVFARHILEHVKDPKIGVLYQNDDLGREVVQGLEQGLGPKASAIVAKASFEVTDPTVDSQIVQLRSSGANVLVTGATARTVAQALRKAAEIGWTPERYVNIAGSSVKMAMEPAGPERSKGTITLAFYKEPASKKWADDPEMVRYKDLLKTHAPDVDPMNNSGASGYIAAQLMAHVLRECGNELTRENIRRIASNLKSPKVELLLPGIVVANSAADLHAVAAMQPMRYNGVDLDPIGPVLALK
jgi:branched-chain amino acid transport system substrate-binding protein